LIVIDSNNEFTAAVPGGIVTGDDPEGVAFRLEPDSGPSVGGISALEAAFGSEPSARFDGPAVIEQLDCTTLIEPGCRVERDRLGNLIITV